MKRRAKERKRYNTEINKKNLIECNVVVGPINNNYKNDFNPQ